MQNKKMNIQGNVIKQEHMYKKTKSRILYQHVNSTHDFPYITKRRNSEKKSPAEKAWDEFLKHAGAGHGPGDLSYNHDAYDWP